MGLSHIIFAILATRENAKSTTTTASNERLGGRGELFFSLCRVGYLEKYGTLSQLGWTGIKRQEREGGTLLRNVSLKSLSQLCYCKEKRRGKIGSEYVSMGERTDQGRKEEWKINSKGSLLVLFSSSIFYLFLISLFLSLFVRHLDEMVFPSKFSDSIPVDRVRVAQVGILLN